MLLTDPAYSTTRMLTSQRPEGLRDLPPSAGRVYEGGLRTKGYYKTSINDKPLISIIVVVLNRVNCIENCILSILGNSYDNIELIIIDGGSTDGTVDILIKYSDTIDYWVSEPDQGLYYAMNKAVGIANGDWLNFIGSDDVLLNNMESVVVHLQDSNTIYYGDVYCIGGRNFYNGPLTPNHLYSISLNQQGVFYPRSVFSTRLYNTDYRIAADSDLHLSCYTDGSYRFVYMQEPITIFDDIQGLSTIDKRIAIRELRSILRKYLGYKSVYYTARLSLMNLLELLKIKKPLKKTMLDFNKTTRNKERLSNASRLLKIGLSKDDVARLVGLDEETIESLSSNLYKAG